MEIFHNRWRSKNWCGGSEVEPYQSLADSAVMVEGLHQSHKQYFASCCKKTHTNIIRSRAATVVTSKWTISSSERQNNVTNTAEDKSQASCFGNFTISVSSSVHHCCAYDVTPASQAQARLTPSWVWESVTAHLAGKRTGSGGWGRRHRSVCPRSG